MAPEKVRYGRRKTWWLVASTGMALLLAVLASLVLLARTQDTALQDYLGRVDQIQPNFGEAQVVQTMGAHPSAVWRPSDARGLWYEYYLSAGFTCPKWEIEGKVMVFEGPYGYLYVHIGKDGYVRAKALGGS